MTQGGCRRGRGILLEQPTHGSVQQNGRDSMLISFTKSASIIFIAAMIAALPSAAWATPVMNRSTQPVKFVADYDMASQTLTILTWDATTGKISTLRSFDCGKDGFKCSQGMDAYMPVKYVQPKATMINDVVYAFGRINDEQVIMIVDCNTLDRDAVYLTMDSIFALIDDRELKEDYKRPYKLGLSQLQVYPNLSSRIPDAGSGLLSLYIAYADKYVQCMYDHNSGDINDVRTTLLPSEPMETSVIMPDPALNNMIFQDKVSGRVYLYTDTTIICYLNPNRVYRIHDMCISDNYIVLVSTDTVIEYSKVSGHSTIFTSDEPDLHRPYVIGLDDDELQLLWFPYDWGSPDAFVNIDRYRTGNN
jgi:hypothetical protein